MRNSTGASLMAAIVIMVLIATLGGTFTFLMSTHYRALPLDTDFAQANSIAHAGVEWTLKNLIPTAIPIPFAGGTFSVTQDGNVFTVTARHGSARVIFTVSPPAVLRLILIPSNGPTGTLLTIQGQGFQSNETLNLASSKYGTEPPVLLINLIDTGTFTGDSISGTNNEFVTTDTIGNFEVTWVVTWLMDPPGASTPFEVDTSNSISDPEAEVFTVVPGLGYIFLVTPINGFAGTPLLITAQDLSPLTNYRLEDETNTTLRNLIDVDQGSFDGDIVFGSQNQRITTDASGGFQIIWQANWLWTGTGTNLHLIDIKGVGFLSGVTFTLLRPLLTLTPNTGGENTVITIKGNGFYSNNAPESRINLTYDAPTDQFINLTTTATYIDDLVSGNNDQNITAGQNGDFEVIWTMNALNLDKSTPLLIGPHVIDTNSTQDPEAVILQFTRPGIKGQIRIPIIGRVQTIKAGFLNDKDDPDTNFPDIVIGTRETNKSGNIEVWLNTADETGNITQHQVIVANNYVNAIDLAAFDQTDTEDDILAGNNATNISGRDAIEIWINDGTGLFSEDNNSPYDASGRVYAVDHADMDGDDTDDILYASIGRNAARRTISVRLNIGSSDFGPPSNHSSDGNFWALTTNDFNEDTNNDTDAAAGTDGNSGELKVYNNNGSGVLSEDAQSPYGTAGNEVFGMDSGDVDDDGFIDIAVGTRGNNATARQIEIWKNDGNGNFTLLNSYEIGFQINTLVLADMNQDGDLDIVIGIELNSVNDGEIQIWNNDGAGNFSLDANSPIEAGGNVLDLDVADMDQDDTNDIVAAIRTGNTTGTIEIILRE